MADYQEISEQISAFVAAKGRELTDGVPDLAANYASFCREANARLRRCSEYLRKGMRSEAIHLADCQPNLFQLVEGLQIPQQQEWARICAMHRLPIPPALFIECIGELKKAYAVERELLPLLSRHRLLALARAKLVTRLELLRLLVDADPDNTCWIDEIRTLEAARLHEMRVEAKAAIRAYDIPALKKLNDELNSQPWLCDVPSDLAIALNSRPKRPVPDFSEVRGLASGLRAAFEARTVDEQVFSDLRRWHELTTTTDPDFPNDLIQETRPALQWLVDQKARAEQREADRTKSAQSAINLAQFDRTEAHTTGLVQVEPAEPQAQQPPAALAEVTGPEIPVPAVHPFEFTQPEHIQASADQSDVPPIPITQLNVDQAKVDPRESGPIEIGPGKIHRDEVEPSEVTQPQVDRPQGDRSDASESRQTPALPSRASAARRIFQRILRRE